MAIHVQIDPLERTATLRGVHSLCAGESSEVILSGVPDADTPTLSLRVYRDATESVQVACSVRPGTGPVEEGLVPVEGRAALRRGVLDLRSSAVSEWASEDAEAAEAAEEARRSGSKEPEARAAASYRRPDSAWLVVADSSRVWAACAVPFVLRPFDDALSPDPEVPLPSYAERAEAAAQAAESAASAASASALEASQAAARATAATDGKADLVDGKVPASQLPSYVDDVLEVAELPSSGDSGKLYVVTGTNAVYRWSGSSFVEVSPSRDWSGELAAKRDRTDFSVGDGWLLVAPDGTQAWLGRVSPPTIPGAVDQWGGGGYLVIWTGDHWTLGPHNVPVDSPAGSVRLDFVIPAPSADASLTYRLYRGSRLALDTEIPTVPTPVAPSTDASAQGRPADAKATGDFILRGLEFDPEDTEYEAGSIVLYEGKLYRCVYPHSGPWSPGNFRETSITGEINYLVFSKYAKPSAGIPEADLADSVRTALSAILGKADAADLLYRIAEVGRTARLPDSAFPITYTNVVTTPQSYTITSADNVAFLEFPTAFTAMDKQNPTSYGALYGFASFNKTTGVYSGSDAFIGDLSFNGSATATLGFIRTLADRTVNHITATNETGIDIGFPNPETGRSRDFYLAVTCGSTVPTLNAPSGVALVNSKGEPPDLSLSTNATTVLRFTEVKEAGQSTPAVFCVTGGANGGGDSAYPMVPVTPSSGTLTVTPYTVVTYTAGDSAAAFTVAVGAGETGKARDCELVIDCTTTGAVAPTVTWPSNFHPRTDADDFACEAGVRNVYYISEYATGQYVVGGWQETTGGNA